MYYDDAALIGGWEIPTGAPMAPPTPGDLGAWTTAGVAAIPRDMYNKIVTHVGDAYPELQSVDPIIGAAFMYDSALMNGDPAFLRAATSIKNQLSVPGKKAFKYVRRVVHTGGSQRARRPPMTREQRVMRMALKLRDRAARREYLRANDWWGSDPFAPGSRSRYGAYEYLYTLPPTARPRLPDDQLKEASRKARLRLDEDKQRALAMYSTMAPSWAFAINAAIPGSPGAEGTVIPASPGAEPMDMRPGYRPPSHGEVMRAAHYTNVRTRREGQPVTALPF